MKTCNTCKCGDCHFWEFMRAQDFPKGSWGVCHRYPPPLRPTEDGWVGKGLLTGVNYWCGEHTEREGQGDG